MRIERETHLLKGSEHKPVWFGLHTCPMDSALSDVLSGDEHLLLTYRNTQPTYFNGTPSKILLMCMICLVNYSRIIWGDIFKSGGDYGSILIASDGNWDLEDDNALHYGVCERQCSS